jgi:hypothetical protein
MKSSRRELYIFQKRMVGISILSFILLPELEGKVNYCPHKTDPE